MDFSTGIRILCHFTGHWTQTTTGKISNLNLKKMKGNKHPLKNSLIQVKPRYSNNARTKLNTTVIRSSSWGK